LLGIGHFYFALTQILPRCGSGRPGRDGDRRSRRREERKRSHRWRRVRVQQCEAGGHTSAILDERNQRRLAAGNHRGRGVDAHLHRNGNGHARAGQRDGTGVRSGRAVRCRAQGDRQARRFRLAHAQTRRREPDPRLARSGGERNRRRRCGAQLNDLLRRRGSPDRPTHAERRRRGCHGHSRGRSGGDVHLHRDGDRYAGASQADAAGVCPGRAEGSGAQGDGQDWPVSIRSRSNWPPKARSTTGSPWR
jgi:hypothetical protein